MQSTTPPKKKTGLALRIGLMFSGIACALITLILTFTLFPNLLPTRLRDPLDQRTKNETRHIRFTEDQSDLYAIAPGSIRPVENPQLLAEFDLSWDEDGFRVPAMTADHYPIIALGDSYTEAPNAAFPWSDVLARELNIPVRNLGYRGYGPVEYQAIMEDYGKGDHQWILIAFFEGNDLENIRTSTEEPNTAERLQILARERLDNVQADVVIREDGNYPYPLALFVQDQYFEVAFFDPYLWVLNAAKDAYTNSRNVEILGETVENIQAVAGDACVGVVYLPSKEHIYFPYAEPNGRRWILEVGNDTVLGEDDWLSSGEGMVVDFDQFTNRLNHQRDAVQAAVEATGATFIDLTPTFETAAAEGQLLYYVYDTHWNQAGHELAGSTVANFLRTSPNCPVD